jgi:hypothetical protein
MRWSRNIRRGIRLQALVDERVFTQSLDFVFHLQFASLEFGDSEIVGRGMGAGFVEFAFERLMPLFQILKLRWDWHVLDLQNWWLRLVYSTPLTRIVLPHRGLSTSFCVCGAPIEPTLLIVELARNR